MRDLTPRRIVAELDRYIVGQDEAKRAVAIAVRNRWRRQQLCENAPRCPQEHHDDRADRRGEAEIARRLAKLTAVPFIKVKPPSTEVGYYGRDVESMVTSSSKRHRVGPRD